MTLFRIGDRVRNLLRCPCRCQFALAETPFGCIDCASKELAKLASVKTPTQIEQTRIGLFDLRAELTTLRERGLSNRTQLRVTERSCFRATQSPVSWACNSATESAPVRHRMHSADCCFLRRCCRSRHLTASAVRAQVTPSSATWGWRPARSCRDLLCLEAIHDCCPPTVSPTRATATKIMRK
jgi:hypothetical protein